MTSTSEILLVEDNPDDAELATLALQARNVSVKITHVIDGQLALDYLFARDAHADRNPANLPAVVLLDLKLPKVDGLEVLGQVRADPRFQGLPIVVLTSSAQGKDILTAYTLGANSYIVKPVDFEEFSKTIGDLGEYWLRHNQAPGILLPPK